MTLCADYFETRPTNPPHRHMGRPVAHHRHIQISTCVEDQRPLNGVHDPLARIAKRTPTEQRQIAPVIARGLRIQDRGQNRRFVGRKPLPCEVSGSVLPRRT